MKQSIVKRVSLLEDTDNQIDYETIRLIESGKTYGQLTDEQKTAYCRYHGFDREAFEEVNLMVLATTDVSLELKSPPMTPEEERKHLKEVAEEIERYMNQALEENDTDG